MKNIAKDDIKASSADLHDAVDDVKSQAQEARVSEQDKIIGSGFFKRITASATAMASGKNRVFRLLQRAYTKLSRERGREQFARDIVQKFNLFLRFVKAYYRGEYRNVPWSVIVKIIAALLYFVTIIDLIPDFIPIIGYTDDLAVLLWVYTSIEGELIKFSDWEYSHSDSKKT